MKDNVVSRISRGPKKSRIISSFATVLFFYVRERLSSVITMLVLSVTFPTRDGESVSSADTSSFGFLTMSG